MKTMTCKQLGGACNKEFRASTFEEMSMLSQNHGFEMLKKGDMTHIEAMDKMKILMENPEAINAWMEKTRQEFDEQPESEQ